MLMIINQWIACFFPIFYFQILFGRLGVSWQYRFKSPWLIYIYIFCGFSQKIVIKLGQQTGGPPFFAKPLGLAFFATETSEVWNFNEVLRHGGWLRGHWKIGKGRVQKWSFWSGKWVENGWKMDGKWMENGWKMDGTYVNQQQIEGLAMV